MSKIIIPCEEFDAGKLSLQDLPGMKRYTKSIIKYIQYEKKPFGFATDWIMLTYGSIPYSTAGIDEIDNFNTDKDRMFIQLYNDPEQPACNKLFKTLRNIDTHMQKLVVKKGG